MKRNRGILGWALLSYFFFVSLAGVAHAQTSQLRHVADAAMARWPAGTQEQASSENGLLLDGLGAVWMSTADGRYFNYIKASIDPLVEPDGTLASVHGAERDRILLGRQLMLLYGVTLDVKYAKAARALYEQLQPQFRRADDDPLRRNLLLRAAPFYAEYAATFDHPEAFKELTRQFVLADEHSRKNTESSSQVSARAMGACMMALVDTLDYYPAGDPGRAELEAQAERGAAAITRYQDAATGAWHRELNKPSAQGNPLDSSVSRMFVYALAKGVRRGYLHSSDLAVAQRGDQSLRSIAANSISDPESAGLFLLAGTETEASANAKLGRGKTVLMDAWFNSQKRADAFGREVSFHYKWNDMSDSGFSQLGHLFRSFGATTATLYGPPTRSALHSAQVYIIVSPDIPVKNPSPNYMQPQDAAVIADWVKAGGVLMILENDAANADLDHLNLLADRFGIHYNSILRKHVIGTQWDMGKVAVPSGGTIFHDAHTIYVKDVSTITAKAPAVAQLIDSGDILMATAHYGRGTVFAMTDPWLYNEYTDGRKLPVEYDNFAAGKEVVRWALSLVPPAKTGPLKIEAKRY